MANLTVLNQDLRTQLETAKAQLASLQSTMQQLTANQQQNNNSSNNRLYNNNNTSRYNNNSNSNRRNTSNNRSNQNRPRPVAYCWTHGGILNPFDTSQSCMLPAPGHVQEATLQDMQGGNTCNT